MAYNSTMAYIGARRYNTSNRVPAKDSRGNRSADKPTRAMETNELPSPEPAKHTLVTWLVGLQRAIKREAADSAPPKMRHPHATLGVKGHAIRVALSLGEDFPHPLVR